MDAGTIISDEVTEAFTALQTKHKFDYVIFNIADGKVNVEKTYSAKEAGEVKYDTAGERADLFQEKIWSQFFDVFSTEYKKSPRFAVVDFAYKASDGRVVERVLFIKWCPDSAKIREKMVQSATTEKLASTLDGIQKKIQATDLTDLDYETVFKAITAV